MVSWHTETARFKSSGHKNELCFLRNTLLHIFVNFGTYTVALFGRVKSMPYSRQNSQNLKHLKGGPNWPSCTAWESDNFRPKHTYFVTHGGPIWPSWHSLRKWSFFVTNRHFSSLTGAPTDLRDTAWEIDHFSLQTDIFCHSQGGPTNLLVV